MSCTSAVEGQACGICAGGERALPDENGAGAVRSEFINCLCVAGSGNLFVSIETFTNPGADSIVYFTPSGVGTTFATGLTTPRGLAFDGSGNLFVAECADCDPTNGEILEFAPGGGAPTVFTSVFGRPQFLTFGPPR